MFAESPDPFAIVRPCLISLRFAFSNKLIGPFEIFKLLKEVHEPLARHCDKYPLDKKKVAEFQKLCYNLSRLLDRIPKDDRPDGYGIWYLEAVENDNHLLFTIFDSLPVTVESILRPSKTSSPKSPQEPAPRAALKKEKAPVTHLGTIELHDTDSETDSSTAPNKEKAPIVYLGAFEIHDSDSECDGNDDGDIDTSTSKGGEMGAGEIFNELADLNYPKPSSSNSSESVFTGTKRPFSQISTSNAPVHKERSSKRKMKKEEIQFDESEYQIQTAHKTQAVPATPGVNKGVVGAAIFKLELAVELPDALPIAVLEQDDAAVASAMDVSHVINDFPPSKTTIGHEVPGSPHNADGLSSWLENSNTDDDTPVDD